MRTTRKLAIPTGFAVAVITAVAPASAALACGDRGTATASSFQASHGRGHHTHWRHWHGFYGIAGQVASYDGDTGRLTVDTTSGTTISGTITSKTKVWLDEHDSSSSMTASSVKALHDDDGDDDATRAEALAALKPGVDVKVMFTRSGALAAVKIQA
ncbi:hypothetical protein ACIB24_06590 [Spongisporangium articulatum]|uniref:DUF5666 domain-containing protein n=1 Tax=Spongisporangium articulatum TaxID=3362603 RepID=A0ABW8AM70_9ACTN